jgi:AraC-like DNA-binding protein
MSGDSPRHSYVERIPMPALVGVVASVWVQSIAADTQPYVHREIPHGGFDVVCELGGTVRIVGPQSGPTQELLGPGSIRVGLRLRPGTASQVLGVAASRLVDLVVPAEDVIGAGATALAERIAASGSPMCAARLLQRMALAGLRDRSDADLAVAGIVSGLWRNLDAAVSDVGSRLYVSERQMRRLCRERVGFAPKALQRVLRIQRFLAHAQRNLAVGSRPHGDGLVGMATVNGFADQAHLTRECVRLTGQTPATLLRQIAQSCANHDHSASYASLTARSG